MRELSSKGWIVLKGVLFAGIALAAAALVLLESPSWRTAAALVLKIRQVGAVAPGPK